MGSDRYRGQAKRGDSRFDDRQDTGRARGDAGPGNSPAGREREDEYRQPYEPDPWDMAPQGDFRSQDRPYPESQADGDPSYSRSRARGEDGQRRGGTRGPGQSQSQQSGMRGGSDSRSGSFDGFDRSFEQSYDRGEPARQRATGGGYGEYNYRDEDSPSGGGYGQSGYGRSGFGQSGFGTGRTGQGPEPSWRPGESRGQFSGKGPKGYQRSDERVREDVSDILERNGELDASEIEVVVVAGEVTLQGGVTDRRAKRLAEDLIEDLPGVKQVHNRLRVGDGSSKGDGSSEKETEANRSSSRRSS